MDSKIWERRKLTTSIVFVFEYLISAIELSITYSTSWLYLKEVTENFNDIKLYYGVLHVAKCLPPILLINVVAHYSDKYRRIKLVMITANYITLVGCVIYLIPGSPMFLIIGRFFVGFNLVTRPLLLGEMARSFTKDKFVRIVLMFRSVSTFGKAAGPLLVIAFTNISFNIGPLNIRYSNAASFVTFCAVSLLQVAIYIFVHDLSREYDYKTINSDTKNMDVEDLDVKNMDVEDLDFNEKKENKTSKEDLLSETNKEKSENEVAGNDLTTQKSESENAKLIDNNGIEKSIRKSPYQLFKLVIHDADLRFIMFSAFAENLLTQMLPLIVPVIILEQLQYDKNTVNIVMVFHLFLYLLFTVLIYFFKLRVVNDGLIGWVSNIIALSLILVVSRSKSYEVNMVLLISILTLQEVSAVKVRVFLSVSLAAMVDSKYQSFMDSLRLQMLLLAGMAGSMLAGIATRYLTQVVYFSLAFSSLFLILTLLKRKVFLNPKIKT